MDVHSWSEKQSQKAKTFILLNDQQEATALAANATLMIESIGKQPYLLLGLCPP